jgi:ribonuclease R
MYDKEIEIKVMKLLDKESNKSYNMKDIQIELELNKHKRRDLLTTLQAMVKDEKISYQNKKYFVNQPNRLAEGIFDARPLAKDKSFAFVICSEFDVFVSSEDTLNAYHNDTVQVEISYNKSGKRYGKVRKVIKRNTTTFTGSVQKTGKNYQFLPDLSKIHTPFFVLDTMNAQADDKVLFEISNWGNPDLKKLPAGKVIEIIGKSGIPEIEIISIIKQFDIPLEFPDIIWQELDKLKVKEDYSKRRDLRNLLTFTIDPETAKDFDDAISFVKNGDCLYAYTHIADVAEYVKPQTEIFKEAVKRGNSYYYPKKVIPMLPEKISNNLCSLRPDEDKLTITVETHFDFSYCIIKQTVYESVIRSNARFSYIEIDEYFAGTNKNIEKEIANALNEMRKLSEVLSQKRIQRGYLFFNLPEAEFFYNDDGYIQDIKRSEETESHKLIENFMLLANEYVAELLSNKTTLYRVHEQPDEQSVQEIITIAKLYQIPFDRNNNSHTLIQSILQGMKPLQHRVFDRMILRNMKKARYDIVNLGHYGLAAQKYTHFTSPIRRLCDLVVHHQIKQVFQGKGEMFSQEQLKDFAFAATQKELVADESEREVEWIFKKAFMKDKIGNTYSCVIIGLLTSSLLVELDEFPVTAKLRLQDLKDDYYQFIERSMTIVGKRNGKIYRLADVLQIQITSIEDDIYVIQV